MTRFIRSMIAVAAALTVVLPARVPAQTPAAGGGIVVAGTSTWVPARSSGAAPLRRTVTLDLDSVSVRRAIAEIAKVGDLAIGYGQEVTSSKARVSLHGTGLTVGEALTAVLQGTGLEAYVSVATGRVVVRAAPPEEMSADTRPIIGRVTDKKTGAALAGATVVVQGTSRSATTGNDGRYRIADVPPGTYTVRARYIGYAPGSVSVTVSADQEATADFTLEKSAQRLDEVVTTGTVVPTEVKALPTPVSIISESDLELQRPHTVQEIFRQAVPTAVSWDLPDSPHQTAFSVRGASGLSGGSGQMKVFVDGIEVANTTTAFIDPNSIDRVEVIRGPQAAAIYGSDAVGGVIQVFTKRGDPSLTRPQVDVEAAVGALQTPYDGYSAVLRQSYRGTVSGGGPDVSYNFGAGYTHTPDWVQPASRQSSASIYGGVHLTRGLLTADVTGRQYIQNTPGVFNPDLASTGSADFAKPDYQPAQNQAQTLGARLTLASASWWHHTVTLGMDRWNQDVSQTQPRLTTPADTFFLAENLDQAKTSIGYNTSVTGVLAGATTGSLTLGFDHYSLALTQWSTGSALSTSLSTGNFEQASATRTTTNNTGYFAQGQLAFHDVLFLTGGLRAEQNTNFGDSLGTPLSPQVGLTYVHTLGETMLKLRGSWGRAIRPPTPGAKLGIVGPGSVQMANPQLSPERQRGWDTGLDVVFGARGSLSVTYYNQTAENLIASVQSPSAPVFTYQNQNVGRVKNSGIEIEGTVSAGSLQLKGQYGYVRSRIEDLGTAYSGDLQVGDQPLFIPSHTAGASLAVAPFAGTRVAAGLTYVGSWNGYDSITLIRCFAGTGPCRPGPGLRDYVIAYPSLTKLNATISQQITPRLSGFVSVDNLTNNRGLEFSQFDPVIGRITTVGVRFHY